MTQSVRIWQKKKLRIDLLTFRQREMVDVGAPGLLAFKKRLAAGLGPNDTAAKPLTRRYAIFKSRMHKGNRRDLWFTGKMLGNLQLRTVSDNMVKAAFSSQKERDKAHGNERRDHWFGYSPQNRQTVLARFRQLLANKIKDLVKII